MNHRIMPSPLGPVTLVVDEPGVLTHVLNEGQAHMPPASVLGDRDDTVAADAAEQLAEYFDGARTTFSLPLAPTGTDFQMRVWDLIAAVPYGQTVTYGDVAAQLGSPNAARAVGAATGRNPLAIVVPCHRLVASSGALTGYAGGLKRKTWLLDHEQRHQ